MAHFNFVIPATNSDLLTEIDDNYYVKDVVGVKQLYSKLRDATQSFKDEGIEFIVEHFDTFYSVLHHNEILQIDLIAKAHEMLLKPVQDLKRAIAFALENVESLDEESKLKYQNIMKMLLFVYINISIVIEQKIERKRSQNINVKLKGRKKAVDEDVLISIDRKMIILSIQGIFQENINIFWDPPVVDDVFVSMAIKICYHYFELPFIKAEKQLQLEIFHFIGTLIKDYNHSSTFSQRIVQLIKICEHLTLIIPECVKILVENYNCKSLVRDLVKELTEWQTEESFQDSHGTKFCALVLAEMAKLMPSLMIREIMYLNRYLDHDSYVLRNSILNVITEIVLTVLTRNNLTEEERVSRDTFLNILEDHIYDCAGQVRSNVLQHWKQLQTKNAIPVKQQNLILKKAVFLLRDKVATVRKSAAKCVTEFLSCNIYGANLQLHSMKTTFEQKMELLNSIKSKFDQQQVGEFAELKTEWKKHEKPLTTVIEQKLKESTQDIPECHIAEEMLPDLIQNYISAEKYEEAFVLCRSSSKHLVEQDERFESGESEIFLRLLRTIFIHTQFVNKESIAENLQKLLKLEDDIVYLEKAVEFLQLIDDAIEPMKELIESATIGDMQAAITFFVTAFKFNIDKGSDGFLIMLKLMHHNDQERKASVIEAFKIMYLTTESSSMKEHRSIVVDNLVNLRKAVSFKNFSDLQLIISHAVAKGVIDNNIINLLWQFFTKKCDVPNGNSRCAVSLLSMAAVGSQTIITRNITLVATVGFDERGQKDLLLVTEVCKFLSLAKPETQSVVDPNPPFRVKLEDTLWTNLINILVNNFHVKSRYYNTTVSAAIKFIYTLCSQPDVLCDGFIEKIWTTLPNTDTFELYIIMQINHILGEIALHHLQFLEETVYKELKRRKYLTITNKHNKSIGNVEKLLDGSSASQSFARKKRNTDANVTDESTLEGAQAEDVEAEIILNILENHHLVAPNGLIQLIKMVISVLERPDFYNDNRIQSTSMIALLRCMLVSSSFCEKYVQLVFTILERTAFIDVKCTILSHCSDLLERFPNVIEPWTPQIYQRLQDPIFEVRHASFFMLSNLILRDMIRVHDHISHMARCMVDSEEELRIMCKEFFTQLSRKGQTLYYVLPDIFSHLLDLTDFKEDDLRLIMKSLFSFIDKNKQMENLVDRFCLKFQYNEDETKCKNIAYCLSLITYNEKGLKKLLENFHLYRNLLHQSDLFVIVKQMLNNFNKSTKNEIKALAKELEEKIEAVFSSDPKPAAEANETQVDPFKKPKGILTKKKPKKKILKKNDCSDDENSFIAAECSRPKRKRSSRQQSYQEIDPDDDNSD